MDVLLTVLGTLGIESSTKVLDGGSYTQAPT